MATTIQVAAAMDAVEALLDSGCLDAAEIVAAVLNALEVPKISPHN